MYSVISCENAGHRKVWANRLVEMMVRVRVCVCVYLYVRGIFMCVFVCVCVWCAGVCVCVCVHLCVYLYVRGIFMYLYVRVRVCVGICVPTRYVFPRECMCARAGVRVCVHATRAHTRACVYLYLCLWCVY